MKNNISKIKVDMQEPEDDPLDPNEIPKKLIVLEDQSHAIIFVMMV